MPLEPVTYIPPMWLHNRAVVRKKGTEGPDFLLARLRLNESREASTAQLLPVEIQAYTLEEWAGARLKDEERTSLSIIEAQYEPTGRVMSCLRAPW